jgi:hypothetical protein
MALEGAVQMQMAQEEEVLALALYFMFMLEPYLILELLKQMVERPEDQIIVEVAEEKAESTAFRLTSNTSLFGFPYCVKDVDANKIDIQYTPNRIWLSDTLSSYRGVTNTNQSSISYLMEELKKFTNSVVTCEHDLKLISFWANEYYKKDFQEPHLHGNSDFSFVIFKKIGRSSGLVFFSPAYDLIQSNTFWSSRKEVEDTVECSAKEGQIVIFPSILRHMALPSNEEEVRITYSGNVQVIIENSNIGL